MGLKTSPEMVGNLAAAANGILRAGVLLAALGMDDEARQQLRDAMQGNAEALEQQIEDYVGQQIAENMAQLPDCGSA